MGNVNCCIRPDKKIENNMEAQNLFQSKRKLAKNNGNAPKNLLFDSHMMKSYPKTMNNYSQKDIISNNNTQKINQKNNNNDEDLKKEEKVKKIQEKYRSYYLRNKYKTQIKPSLSIKTSNFINKFYAQCLKGGEVNDDPNFSIDNYKNYYPEDDPFFIFDKGKVYKNQTRLKNTDDPKQLEIYEGETNEKNLKHGYGVLTTPHFVMKGTWRNDEFTGWGEKLCRNGDNFEGKFIKGKLNGKGILKNKEGNIYIGDFVNNIRCGKGDLTTENYHYIGEFKNNKFNGKGKIKFLKDKSVYEGQFEDNEIEGKGKYKWISGDVYEGQMKKGKMDGYGKYIYKDGRIYEGEYRDGKKNGRGKFSYSPDKYYEGIFVDGVPDGEGFYTKDGHTSKVLFSNGEFVKLIA
jgi:hypothetical protein